MTTWVTADWHLGHALRRELDTCTITGWRAAENQTHVTWSRNPGWMLQQFHQAALVRGWTFDPDEIRRRASHEIEHAMAATAVGFSTIHYGFALWDEGATSRWQFAICHSGPTRPVTKLAYAAIMATPRDLSIGDLQGLKEMGYAGRADVIARVAAHSLDIPMTHVTTITTRSDKPWA